MKIERELYKLYPLKRRFQCIAKYTYDTDTGKIHYKGKASVSRSEQGRVYEALLQDIDDYNNIELQEYYTQVKEEILAKR